MGDALRREQDALGTMLLPSEAYYGIQTARACENFDVSGCTLADFPCFLRSLALVKKSAALANRDVDALDMEVAGAIVQAADEVAGGGLKSQFPVDVLQGGGGTSIHMNVNEVLAHRANELLTGHKGYDRVHPHDDVNLGQSTNDVVPTAMRITCYSLLQELHRTLQGLESVLARKAVDFRQVVKLGRTCLQDAIPLTLGQEFGGYLSLVRRQTRHVEQIMAACLEVPLGAGAVGTGLGIPPGYTDHVYPYLSREVGAALKQQEDFFDGLQNADLYVQLSALLKTIATSLSKIATDLRLMSSGPRAGLNEIELPAVQPGSSIMPGKVNPVIPELVNQICYHVCGSDVTITMAVEGAELDLNVWEPVIIKTLFESFRLLIKGTHLFNQKCLEGIEVNAEVCASYAASSLSLATVVAVLFGYEEGCRIARMADQENLSIEEVIVREGLLSKREARELFDPMQLTDGASCSNRLATARRAR